jgi:hypothetical protein
MEEMLSSVPAMVFPPKKRACDKTITRSLKCQENSVILKYTLMQESPLTSRDDTRQQTRIDEP